MIDNNLLEEIVTRLQNVQPIKMYLFGSQAMGTADNESDIDLLLVKRAVSSKIKEINDARKLLRGLGKSFDIIVASQEEFYFYRNQVNSVHHAASNYGRVIYG
ncbi:MAG TPA: nucleotidyltransferase domain-containing protein [Desulfuromonadales bacterium]|nr:nucleotidyltransferase domain-containing protein [Desulfuromonadales bacterium]